MTSYHLLQTIGGIVTKIVLTLKSMIDSHRVDFRDWVSVLDKAKTVKN